MYYFYCLFSLYSLPHVDKRFVWRPFCRCCCCFSYFYSFLSLSLPSIVFSLTLHIAVYFHRNEYVQAFLSLVWFGLVVVFITAVVRLMLKERSFSPSCKTSFASPSFFLFLFSFSTTRRQETLWLLLKQRRFLRFRTVNKHKVLHFFSTVSHSFHAFCFRAFQSSSRAF